MDSRGTGRLVGGATVLLAVVAAVVLLTGSSSYEVTAEFENAGQIVKGNEVIVGGAAAGSVKEIDLGPGGTALITFSVDEPFAPLREGTVVTIRSPSLSQVAGRQLQLSLPAAERAGAEIPSGSTIPQESTVAAVDVDQIFNTLDERTIRSFKRVIQGFERSTEGVAQEANRGFRYLNPMLSTSREVFSELAANDPALEQLIVNGSRLSGALADQRADVSAMVGNLNRMMNALGDRKQRLAESIRLLPDFMRRSNTTFVNLRATLDDVDPLIDASIPTARALRPFMAELRGAARDAVPTLRDLSALIKRPGTANDLIELQRLQPRLARRALGTGFPDCGPGPDNPEDLQMPADDDFTQGAFGESICSLTNGERNLEFFRAYTPELVGWFDTFSHSGYVDAIGGVGRISTTFNAFSPSASLAPNLGELLSPAEQLARLSTGNNRRCPGANERPVGSPDPGDDSVPFTDHDHLTDGKPGECDPSQVAPGP
jgi:phospholipid/cholesterol/gamma-HCH transport system substrate-binding protein